MHITEGIITGAPALFYAAAGVGLVGYGISKMKTFVASFPEKGPLLGMAEALIFFISLLPIPAFTGTCSHPCATPFVAILFGPAIAITLTGGSLLLQASFFAHGGFGTWGANVVALGLCGSLTGWGAFVAARKVGAPLWAAGFAGGLLGDVAVYACSGFILAGELANAPTPQYLLSGYLTVIYAAYLPTQLPIALGEMVITGLALQYIYRQRPEVLVELGVASCGSDQSGKFCDIPPLAILLAASLFLISADQSLAAGEGACPEKEPFEISQSPPTQPAQRFLGMDEAVNEHLAENAGLQPQKPFIDFESMGDIWNALLLLAGSVCGFVLGRWWHLIRNKESS